MALAFVRRVLARRCECNLKAQPDILYLAARYPGAVEAAKQSSNYDQPSTHPQALLGGALCLAGIRGRG